MTPETKKRIAAINSGIIPEGYKKTKVGIVPVEWEVDHIGKHLQEYREISNDIEKYPVYSSSRKGLIPQSDYYDQKEATQTNLGYKIVPVGYVTYRHMSDDDIFHFNFNTTGQSVLVSSEYPVFNANSNANLYYIISCLNEMPRFRYFCRSQKLGGTRTRLYYKNLSMYQLPFPPLPEQQKIAEILTTQDKLIELQEKKIEQLKELKKAYLQKMFPKKGSKYPELRFKGFTEPWEQRKLVEVLSLLKDGTHGTHQNSDNGVYLLSAKNIKNGQIVIDEVTDRKISIEEYETIHSNFKLKEDDVLLTIVGSIGETAILKNPDIATFQRSVAFLRPNEDTISIFLKTEIDTDIFQKELADRKSQSAQPGVYLGELEKIPFYITSIQEQQKIGTFFSYLDNLITLHQRKSEQEKQKKKALMQLLLTGKVRCI